VMRGLAPSTSVAAGGGGLNPLSVANAVRSPSVNRLGSLFDTINRSVTSAFSNFVVVHQPVPGVLPEYDHRPPPPPPSSAAPLQRQQSQTRFPTPPRRGSSQDSTTAAQTAGVAFAAAQVTSPVVAGSSSTRDRPDTQQQQQRQLYLATTGGSDGRFEHVVAMGRDLPPQRAHVLAARPRGGLLLPIRNMVDSTPPSHTDQTDRYNFSQRGMFVQQQSC